MFKTIIFKLDLYIYKATFNRVHCGRSMAFKKQNKTKPGQALTFQTEMTSDYIEVYFMDCSEF